MRRIISTILSISLLLGLSAERLIPCVDGGDFCGEELASSIETADADHQHNDGSTGDHHDGCNECFCPCHAPLSPIADHSLEINERSPEYSASTIHLIPSLALPPPGPIPLG